MTKISLKMLRGLKVAVAHPLDADGQVILDQLKRIGCQTHLIWPLCTNLPGKIDVIFAGVFFETHEEMKTLLRKASKPAPVVIGVINYENPAMLQLVLDLGAVAVTSKPVRSFGIMTNMVVAQACAKEQEQLQNRINRLEKKLSGQKKIAAAKSILMEMNGITEAEAFATMRKQAMVKRALIEDMAQAIINASDLLSGDPKKL